MSFEAKEKSVDKLLNDAIYCIPRNQRRYVWNTQNWNDLYEDVELVVDGISTSHFIGSIVLKNEGKEDGLQKYTVIDGQQRILTLTVFLAAIMFLFKKRNMIDDFNGTLKYLFAKDIKAKDREIVYLESHLTLPKIANTLKDITAEEVAKLSPSAFINTRVVPSKKDDAIVSAFKHFCGKLQNLDNENLLSMRDAIIGIGYVNIISSTDEDSYTIFEILNARGLDLEDHELLKNYIMRYLQPAARRDEAKLIWEQIEKNLGTNISTFFRHYAIHKYNYNNDKKQSISVYKALQNATKGRNVGQLLGDIFLKSTIYTQFLNPVDCTQREAHIYNYFKTKRVFVFRPVLLSLKHLLLKEVISEDQYLFTLDFLFNFYICYKIIGEENSNKLSDTIYKYSYLLETNYSEESLNDFLESMRNKLPSREAFENCFKTIGYSHHWPYYKDSKNKERCQVVLDLIEKCVSGRDINIEVTIEHILPDSEDEKNAQIGNLLFLESSLNAKCSNKSLQEKLILYSDSLLSCPKKFAERMKDRAFDPEKRTTYLSNYLYDQIVGTP